MNPYENCPCFDTEHFHLRLVTMDDAEDLMVCYGDRKAWPIFNADHCTSDFRYTELSEMRECIRFWLECYAVNDFVRWSVIDHAIGKAIGTIEMFDAPGGNSVMRLDLASAYETEALTGELLDLALARFYEFFTMSGIATKVVFEAAGRKAAALARGFVHEGTADFYVCCRA